MEPHALWKSGNFKYLSDEEYDVNDSIAGNIRQKFLKGLNGHVLVEKSPINSLRPNLVHAVFPEAKIVYCERDPVRCIYSNYSRSVNKVSFNPYIALRKYFFVTGTKDLAGAMSKRKLSKQIGFRDIPRFLVYVAKMLYMRQIKGILPFGPKIKNFADIAKEKGLLAFHIEVYKASQKYKKEYRKLYGDQMMVFKMENIMADKNEIKKMIDFIDMPYNEQWAEDIMKTFSTERISESVKQQEIDAEILKLINS
jgi:hypothetical protein